VAEKKIGALILAAGFSSRIEGFKPLLEVGGKKLIEHAIGLFKTSGIDEIVTVVGHRAENLIPVVEAASSSYVINDNYQNGMFSSIQLGVKVLKDACEAFFLLPADIPFVRPTTIQLLLETFRQEPSTLVCYPQFNSRRGHPPLIDCCLAEEILAFKGKGGMREFLGKYEEQARIIPVDDVFVGMDVDTRDDFMLLQKKLKSI